MLADILARKRAAITAHQSTLFPAAMFIHMALKHNWHSRDPVRDLELLADWLGPDFNPGATKPQPVPSLLCNWQMLALSNMLYLSEDMIYALILQEQARVTHISSRGYNKGLPPRIVTQPAQDQSNPAEIFDF